MKRFALQICMMMFCILFYELHAQIDSAKVHLNGQVVGWITAQFENPFILQPGGRFVPMLTGKFTKSDTYIFDFEASFNINGNITLENLEKVTSSFGLNPYRVWARYATDKFELRAGLQKINFGQAKLF